MNEVLEAVENRISVLSKRLASRSGKMPYRDNTPLIEAELNRLEGTRRMILEALDSENNDD